MRMRNVPKFRKVPKGLGRNEPLKHPDHPKPSTRREFLAQGFIAGTASVLLSTFALTVVRDLSSGVVVGCALAAILAAVRHGIPSEDDAAPTGGSESLPRGTG